MTGAIYLAVLLGLGAFVWFALRRRRPVPGPDNNWRNPNHATLEDSGSLSGSSSNCPETRGVRSLL